MRERRDVPWDGYDHVALCVLHAVHVVRLDAGAYEARRCLHLIFVWGVVVEQHAEDAILLSERDEEEGAGGRWCEREDERASCAPVAILDHATLDGGRVRGGKDADVVVEGAPVSWVHAAWLPCGPAALRYFAMRLVQ